MQKVVSIEQAIKIIRPFPCWRIWTVEGGGAERLYTETKGQKEAVSFEESIRNLSPAYFSLVKVKYSNTDGNVNNTPPLFVRIGEATEAELNRLISSNETSQAAEIAKAQETLGRERLANDREKMMLEFKQTMLEFKLEQSNQKNKDAHELREKEHELNKQRLDFEQQMALAKIENQKGWMSMAGTIAGAAVERLMPGASSTLSGFGFGGNSNEPNDEAEETPSTTQTKPKSTGFEIE